MPGHLLDPDEDEEGRPEKEDCAPPEDDIGIGDIVRLKSGGPMLSVEAISESSSGEARIQVHCVWFGDNGQHDRGIFDARTLKLDR